jgi:hypothetical protein
MAGSHCVTQQVSLGHGLACATATSVVIARPPFPSDYQQVDVSDAGQSVPGRAGTAMAVTQSMASRLSGMTD